MFKRSKAAFTLVELLVVMGVFAILSALITINLIKPQTKASLEGSVQTLISDLRQQQVKAMIGDAQNLSTSQPYGIYFEPIRYSLFNGLTYSSANPANFIVNLDSNLRLLSINFPSSQVVFTKRGGELLNFVNGSNSLVVQNTLTGEQKTIIINRMGVPAIN